MILKDIVFSIISLQDFSSTKIEVQRLAAGFDCLARLRNRRLNGRIQIRQIFKRRIRGSLNET